MGNDLDLLIVVGENGPQAGLDSSVSGLDGANGGLEAVLGDVQNLHLFRERRFAEDVLWEGIFIIHVVFSVHVFLPPRGESCFRSCP